jgi:hypothetical protein
MSSQKSVEPPTWQLGCRQLPPGHSKLVSETGISPSRYSNTVAVQSRSPYTDQRSQPANAERSQCVTNSKCSGMCAQNVRQSSVRMRRFVPKRRRRIQCKFELQRRKIPGVSLLEACRQRRARQMVARSVAGCFPLGTGAVKSHLLYQLS